MADGTPGAVVLQDYLLDSYGELKGRLTRRLGCAEQASDALQDIWISLVTRAEQLGTITIQNPRAYLMRMALNSVVDGQRANSRLLNAEEIDSLLDISDPGPGPAQVAEDQARLQLLAQIIETMPVRRRQILLAVRVEGRQQGEVAKRLGLTLRMVQRELKAAQENIAARLGE